MQIFGTNGWQGRPPANLSTLAAYTSCLPRGHVENLHVKSVVQPARTLHASTDPHHFIYAPPYFAVNEAGERSDGPRSASVHIDKVCPQCTALLIIAGTAALCESPGLGIWSSLWTANVLQVALHHYVTKSRAEFEAKMARGCGMGGGESMCTVQDLLATFDLQGLIGKCAMARQDHSLPSVSPQCTLHSLVQILDFVCPMLRPAFCVPPCHLQPVNVLHVWGAACRAPDRCPCHRLIEKESTEQCLDAVHL